MGAYANAFGPQTPEATYVDHGHAETLFDNGEVELNYVAAGDPLSPPLSVDPGPDRVVVGLRQGDPDAGRELPRPRRGSPWPRAVDPHPGPIHADMGWDGRARG